MLRLFTFLFIFWVNLAYASYDINFKDGIILFEKKYYDFALDFFEDYLLKNECSNLEKAEVNYYIAICKVMLNNADKEALYSYIDKYPYYYRTIYIYYEIGNGLMLDKQFDKALQYYLLVDKALSNALLDDVQYKIGYCYFKSGDFVNALSYFDKLVFNDKYKYKSSYYSGYILTSQGNYEEAINKLNIVISIDDYKTIVPYLICKCYYRQKKFVDLLNYLSSINGELELKNEGEVKLMEADSYFFINNYIKASGCYEDYLIMNDLQVEKEVLYRLGYSLYKAKEINKALKYFQQLCSYNESIGQLSNYYVGLILLNKEKHSDALRYLKKAYEGNSLGDTVYNDIALSYAKVNYNLNKFDTAIDVLKHIIECNDDVEEHSEAHKLLDTTSELIIKSYLHNGNYLLGIDYINKLPIKDNFALKSYQELTYRQALKYINDDNYDSALTMLEISVKNNYDISLFLDSIFWMGELSYLKGDYDKAIELYLSIVNNDNLKLIDPKVYYSLGYAYYNNKDYSNACNMFKKYCGLANNSTSLFKDSMIRWADCSYVMKNYNEALKYYGYSINNGYNLAHSYYYKATIWGILGNIERAVKCYEFVINNCSESVFYEKSIFYSAQLYFNVRNYNFSILLLNKFISDYPNSDLTPKALLNRANAYLNLNNTDLAIKDYEFILKNFPTNNTIIQNALMELRKIVNDETFDKYLNAYKFLNDKNGSLDFIDFETAKDCFYKQDYNKSKELLSNFIQNNPNSVFIKEAVFLLGECYYRLSNKLNALENYYKLTSYEVVPFYNKVLSRIAEIEYEEGNFENSINYYLKLKSITKNSKEGVEASYGVMRCYFELGSYESAISYANDVYNSTLASPKLKYGALLVMAKVAIINNDHHVAIEKLRKLKDSVIGTNSKCEVYYLLAEQLHIVGEYNESLELLFLSNGNYGFNKDIINKNFLLIADNYLSLNDFNQAKATLNSIIEKSDDEQVVIKAKAKLNELIDKESSEVKIK